MTDDEKRKKAEAVIKATEELERALRGEDLPAGPPAEERFFAGLDRFIQLRKAEAEVVAQAIELALPVLALNSANLRSIERILGLQGASDAPRAPAWLQLPLTLVGNAMEHVGQEDGHTSGPVVASELYFLPDGRLGEITRAGQWEEGTRTCAIVRAIILEPYEALRRWDFSMIMVVLHTLLTRAEGDDAAVRRERLQVLLDRAAGALLPAIESLEAVVRPG